MNAVVYYSNTGQSKRVAEHLAKKTSFELLDIARLTEYVFDTAVLVFPVHCQNVPDVVKDFLARLSVNNLAVIATYGRMCYGDVLHFIQRRYNHNIIAAAYLPTKHSYLIENGFDDFDKLTPIVSKLNAPSPIKIPKTYKNPLSDFCKVWRSRMGVRLYKDGRCDECGACNSVCDNNAIKNGKPNRKCIRCLKCVTNCPKGALHFSLRLPMRVYLRKKKVDRLVIYV